MSKGSFDHAQLSSIRLAADCVAKHLGAEKEKDRLIVARAVFDLAADLGVFDEGRLMEIALQELTVVRGWRFSRGRDQGEE